MASVASVSLLSEAEFGCEHLASKLTNDGPASDQFKKSFLNANNALGRTNLDGSSTKIISSRFLKPKYTCVACSEVFMNGDRKAHADKTGHQFYMESRSRALFCQSCEDFVYDHGLERFRSSTPEVTLQVSKKRRFSDSSADELYVRSNATKRPCAKQGVRGLFNLGQTCYLNVILQTLLHDPILNTYFLGNGHQPHDCTVPDCVGCAVSEAFADFNSCDKAEGFAALNLLLASWRASPALAGYQQQDAHEYYQFLVDKLHASTDGHREGHGKGCSCFFHRTFYGKLRSSVTCDKCGNITRTEDPMVDLSLDVQVQAKKRAMGGAVGPPTTPTLNGCLESFTSPEKLMAGVYNCSGCGGTPQKATKQLRIKKLPAILCMQLKRFEHTFSVSEKVEGRIDFPLSINMLPYTTNPNSRVDKSRYIYDLSSAVVHKGKLEAGHYYVYCRQGDQWMLFNDDQVTAVSEADVLGVDAYLLFYNLRSLSTAPP
ncbi:hypothetical protein P175DRAFT_0511588 [Aspergillus ochraceoroseus IBT 24754]|uniref:Ubiquitin carboxyl-terminal hydrolase n=3 Tax=Aspergillus subgen. Nidulantes TaxID=2720870 RepID=A0A0F8WRC8_9EURO|nr:uncharacterized protein P175DRAFT_0511588 [Aspergillus ochraceoroseus IBT 24754]KKK13802.1 ubiquitin carboxyl-terminal hydrolase [Aspergillus rambellii]KKK16829.1 ubiquitin carboxyl-terminal hydrolase [Aspergillus ochraceoroseus]PTU18137.1 hypothetical protein P175DRAFT_0511588 [Aspergillus ochraceoroseus IBT 24754]